MKLFNILVSSCLSVFLYFMLQSIWGTAGINSCAEMNQYKIRLETNIEQLKDFQAQMNSDLTRLENDETRLRQEAYRIGLVNNDEVRIRLSMTVTDTIIAPGYIAQKPIDENVSQAVITGISISIGLVLLLLMSFVNFEAELISGKNKLQNSTRLYQGVRVHTASLE